MLLELFIIGLIVGFLYYELVGISPGGIVPPAYFALFIHRPDRMLVTIAIALVVYAVLRWLEQRTFLFGRRRLLLALLLGFSVKWIVERWVAPLPFVPMELHAIGYVIPGLIANEMVRQKIVPTFLSLGIVTIIVALLAMLLGIGIVL